MAIADDFIIDTEVQRIYHTGSSKVVYSLNALYTYLTGYFDDDVRMDDLPPMSAQTPTAFKMENGWFIDPISLRYLNGGSLATLGWDASAYANGIRKKAYNGSGAGTPFDMATYTDIGRIITETDSGDTGIIIYYDESLGTETGYVWIRPDALTDTFADVNSAYTVTGSSAAGVFSAASTTGENVWANIFTLGSLATNSQIFLYQNDTQITPWWTLSPSSATTGLGHIDVLVLVKEAGTLIDYGNVTVFARKYTSLFDHYTADLSAGARTPIPIATFDDSNNLSGYRTFTAQAGTGSGTFEVGEIIHNAAYTIEGIVTAVGGTAGAGSTPILTYYLFKYPLTDFVNGTVVVGNTSGAGCTASAPTDTGPAAAVGITLTFGATSENLNNGASDRPYDVIIDCNNIALGTVYQYLKYVTRYGSNTSINGHTGESYTAVGEIRLPYNTQTVAFSEGTTVNGQTSGATGIIVSDHDAGATGALILRDVTGTWALGENVRVTTTVHAVAGTPETISPSKQAPFGTFAGGKFFAARGVWLTNVATTDANNYQLIDSTNATQIPPTSITLTVAGVESGDRIAVFRATGDNNTVEKSMYNIYNAHTSGVDSNIRIEEAIPNDTPQAGFVRVVRRNANNLILGEEKYEYDQFVNESGYARFHLKTGTISQNYTVQDTVYVPYIDTEATTTSYTVALISTNTLRRITARVRKSGILPFMIKSSFNNANVTITAVRATDSIA